MLINEKLFIIVPLIALLLNAFLFLTCLSAKKNKVIIAFLILLSSLTCWTGGSFLMRINLMDQYVLWFYISLTGIFTAPVTFYNFVYFYTNQKGTFARRVWMILWLVFNILNVTGIAIRNPVVEYDADGKLASFTYEATFLLIGPIVACVFMIIAIFRMMLRSVKNDGVPIEQYVPLMIAVCCLFLGAVNDVIPGLATLPTDTFGCAITAGLFYYVLYKKRLITLTHITANSPTYLISAIFTTIILVLSYSAIDLLFDVSLHAYAGYKTVVVAIIFSMMTIMTYNIMRVLVNNLFVRNIESRESELKKFSQNINKTLYLDEILTLYKNFITDNIGSSDACICIYNESSKTYRAVITNETILPKKFEFRADNPLVSWLQKNNSTIRYRDFQRTNSYRAMWESEKTLLADLNVDIMLPIMSDDVLIGITLFSNKLKNKMYSVSEINYMESAAAIVSIAIMNASLYATMQNEAQRDSLTDLYNRRYFMNKVKQDFEFVKFDTMVLMLISFDDFRLYNELYGTYEGDTILKRFSEILLMAVGDEGMVARFGGKEFIISLPFYDAQRAHDLASMIKERLDQCLSLATGEGNRYLTFSAGICEYPIAASTLDELLNRVNMAVYIAKRNGKNRIEVYTPRDIEDEPDQSALDYESKLQIAENCSPTIFALTAAIDAKDHYTFNHSNNVSYYASELAKAIPLDREHVEIIRQAGLMHDIGKIGIPDSILSKKSELTEKEQETIEQHVEASIAMIRHIPSLDYVIPTAIGHHERWDGKGYPRGLKGDEIPIGARCLCIADSFDAMTTKRPYRDALTIDKAVKEIKTNFGKQFDPELGKMFIKLIKDGKIKKPNRE